MYLLVPLLVICTLTTAATVHLSTRNLNSRLANIHLRSTSALRIDKVTYGSCADRPTVHHVVQQDIDTTTASRIVWVIPVDAPASGCLSAWKRSEVLGRSGVLQLQQALKKRQLVGIKMDNSTGIDTTGPWFDGVENLKVNPVSTVDEATAKAKKIGIVGGGPAGMMIAILLQSLGFWNWEILESSKRLGGRIRTVYLEGGPDDYQYQEMGPMRFPYQIRYAGTNETLDINDHKIVFQLGDYLNNLNNHDPKLAINFIEFIQTNPNTPYYIKGLKNPNGTYITLGASASDPRFASPSYPVQSTISSTILSKSRIAEVAKNMFLAHKRFIDEGLDNWSEFSYIHNVLKANLSTTDAIGADPGYSYWLDLYETTYFSNSFFKTIDKGLEQIPRAFSPHLLNRTHFRRRIEALKTFDGKTQLFWRETPTSRTLQNATYDYAVIAVPFTQVRQWRLSGLSQEITQAISNLGYSQACKIALHFRTRWWEKLDPPIFGGCTRTDIPGIGSFCYPSYHLNSSGPGVLLASYSAGDIAIRQVALTEEVHVQKTLEAMAEIHGPVVWREYTGLHYRQCWVLDANIGAGWANPNAGQHELFIPEYFKTINGTVFIGEHTSYTHAWIASALESAIRGAVQICLDLGLVDEAKNVTETWMGRWISV
ncbi:L-amino-acid oxidase [Trichophaea hybrida]|nr:L-amino-acid oxidase [Trichophaea hybrida]